MNKPSPAPEPSMEEILASIRRIISDGEDQVTGADDERQAEHEETDAELEAEAEAAASADTPEEDGDDENILDLTEEMFVGGPKAEVPLPEEEPAPKTAMPIVGEPGAEVVFRDLQAKSEPSRVEEAPAAREPVVPESRAEARRQVPPPREAAPSPAKDEPEAAGDTLMSPATDATVAAAFGQLATNILSQDSRTIEDLVSELLRPMLREWLDDNLPGLVERLVRAEIERVSRGR